VKYLQININKYNPLKGSSWIPTPVFLQNKKCIINVNNRDNYCFLWSLVACILFNTNRKTKNLFRINDCSLLREFFPNYSNFSFPMSLKSIRHFEESNQICSINVFGFDSTKNSIIGPFYKTLNEKSIQFHFTWIKDMSRRSFQVNYQYTDIESTFVTIDF